MSENTTTLRCPRTAEAEIDGAIRADMAVITIVALAVANSRLVRRAR
jgi:hypothetical protein